MFITTGFPEYNNYVPFIRLDINVCATIKVVIVSMFKYLSVHNSIMWPY